MASKFEPDACTGIGEKSTRATYNTCHQTHRRTRQLTSEESPPGRRTRIRCVMGTTWRLGGRAIKIQSKSTSLLHVDPWILVQDLIMSKYSVWTNDEIDDLNCWACWTVGRQVLQTYRTVSIYLLNTLLKARSFPYQWYTTARKSAKETRRMHAELLMHK